jgi:hypothetical protein
LGLVIKQDQTDNTRVLQKETTTMAMHAPVPTALEAWALVGYSMREWLGLDGEDVEGWHGHEVDGVFGDGCAWDDESSDEEESSSDEEESSSDGDDSSSDEEDSSSDEEDSSCDEEEVSSEGDRSSDDDFEPDDDESGDETVRAWRRRRRQRPRLMLPRALRKAVERSALRDVPLCGCSQVEVGEPEEDSDLGRWW